MIQYPAEKFIFLNLNKTGVSEKKAY